MLWWPLSAPAILLLRQVSLLLGRPFPFFVSQQSLVAVSRILRYLFGVFWPSPWPLLSPPAIGDIAAQFPAPCSASFRAQFYFALLALASAEVCPTSGL